MGSLFQPGHFIGAPGDSDLNVFTQNILSATAPELTEWLVIDELGKLELAGGGLEPALGQVLARYRQAGTGRILLVIRDTLLAQAISRYGLQGAQVVERLKYLT